MSLGNDQKRLQAEICEFNLPDSPTGLGLGALGEDTHGDSEDLKGQIAVDWTVCASLGGGVS